MGLTIGITCASKQLTESPINAAITSAAKSVAIQSRSGLIPDTPNLDVTFLLPGEFEKPQFFGMQMGGYTKVLGTLYFECAVPERMISSNDAKEYVDAVLEDVVTNAASYFNEEKIPFDTDGWGSALRCLVSTTVEL